MKKNILFLSLLMAFATLTQSCKKDAVDNATRLTVNAALKANQSYQYDLGSFGTEEGASVSTQAKHFIVSATERDPILGKIIYNYTPATSYVGTDEVVIKSEKGSNGGNANPNITFTTIKFTITN